MSPFQSAPETTTSAAPAISEEAISQEAQRLIQTAAAKHGLQPTDVPANVQEQAREDAKKLLEQKAAQAGDTFSKLLEQERERNRILQAQVDAMRQSGAPRSDHEVKVPTIEQARARMGLLAWAKMTIDQRAQSVGINLADMHRPDVERYFGTKSDAKAATDLLRIDPVKYKRMREAARLLGIL
jgi:hypothetical protein